MAQLINLLPQLLHLARSCAMMCLAFCDLKLFNLALPDFCLLNDSPRNLAHAGFTQVFGGGPRVFDSGMQIVDISDVTNRLATISKVTLFKVTNPWVAIAPGLPLPAFVANPVF
ncbi:hypothetical protein [Planctomycetes bacterium K23_9]|uniref:hypothetical protein n=1 Tax=Stieleria marina TaxID=1930275 RepID=UPI0011A0F569